MPQVRSIILLLVLASSVRIATADTVSLVDGRKFDGNISFDAKAGLVILPKNQPSQRIELPDLLAVRIDGKKIDTPKRVAVLVDGARIAATQVLALTDNEVRLKRPSGALISLNPLLLRSIDFQPDAPTTPPPADDFVGVQIRSGDQSEGEIIGLENNRIRVSSVLFGIQEFDTDKHVRSAYFHAPGTSRAAYVVRTTDGSVWHATSIQIDRGTLKLSSDTIGPIDLVADAVVSIDLGPASTEPATTEPVLTLKPGETHNIPLGGKHRAAMMRLSVPKRFVPSRAVAFELIADGKSLRKTSPITSLDEAIEMAVPVEGVTTLTIRCTADGPEQVGVAGEIAKARLVRLR